MNRSSFLKATDSQCIYSLGILRDITSLVNRLIYGEKDCPTSPMGVSTQKY